MSDHSCERIENDNADGGAVTEITGFSSGTWSLRQEWTGGCGGTECYEVFDIKFCPFCGEELK